LKRGYKFVIMQVRCAVHSHGHGHYAIESAVQRQVGIINDSHGHGHGLGHYAIESAVRRRIGLFSLSTYLFVL
jgi:hypothetical protein